MLKVIFSFLLLVLSLSSYSQYTVKGRIIDSLTKTPVDYASVGIFSSADSVVKDGKLSNEKGVFNFGGLTEGNYYIKLILLAITPSLSQPSH